MVMMGMVMEWGMSFVGGGGESSAITVKIIGRSPRPFVDHAHCLFTRAQLTTPTAYLHVLN